MTQTPRSSVPEDRPDGADPGTGAGPSNLAPTPPSLIDKAKAWALAASEWFRRSRLGRTLARYGMANGAQLAGGIAYAALFSIFAALTIGFTAFMAVLGGNDELREAVLETLDETLPGIIDTGNGTGVIAPEQLEFSAGLSVAGAIAAGALLFSAVAVMGALATSVRAMFGLIQPPSNPVVVILRNLMGFVVLTLAVVLTAGLGIVAGAAGEWALDLMGIEGVFAGRVIRILGLLVALAVDWGVVVAIFVVLAGVRPPRRDLMLGALITAIAMGVLRFAGTSVVGGAADNPLLASFAAIVTLLLWVNLAARITLYAAAWTANPPSVRPEVKPEAMHADERPNFVTMSVPATLAWNHEPRTGALLED